MSNRSYGQYCALAKSLDLVGDRWTLLVVRELLDGPKRYVDLLDGLVTMSTDMLASRLRALEAADLVARRTLPPPGAARVYELTETGAGLEAVIDAYVRWGRHLLADRLEGEVVDPAWLVRAVRAFVRPDRPEVDLTVRYEMPEGAATVRITGDAVVVGDEDEVDVTLAGAAEVLAAATDPTRAAALLRSGELTATGSRAALRSLATVFVPASEPAR